MMKWLRLALLNEGVMLSPRGMGCLSLPMTDADLQVVHRGARARAVRRRCRRRPGGGRRRVSPC